MDANDFLTHEELAAESEFIFTRTNGRKIHCRRIGRREYLTLLPVPPAVADTWPIPADETDEAGKTAHRQAELAWLRTLPLDKQIQQRQAVEDVTFRAIALTALKPTLTSDQARRLGDDADRLFAELLTRSGLLPAEPKPAGDGAAAPAGEEAPGAP